MLGSKFFSALTALSAASVSLATTIYMRIEGPTHTIYEETLQATSQEWLTNNGRSFHCNGTPNTTAGVTSLEALQQAGQYFDVDSNGLTYGYVTLINETANNADDQWGVIFNNWAEDGSLILQGVDDGTNTEYESFCYQTLENDQHMLYAFFGDFDDTDFIFLTGPATASVGETVTYTTTYAPPGSWLNDLSTDATLDGQRVYAEIDSSHGDTWTATITFTEAGSYNLKAHCAADTACVRSNHLVTVVS
jgi:hypothetical protein